MNYSPAFDDFWALYGQDERMDVTAKGSKRKAFEAWQKACRKWCREEGIAEDEAKFSQTVRHGYGLHANNRRNARRVPNKFVPPLPMVSTYLNQFRFEAEVREGSGDLKRQEAAASAVCKCGQDAIGIDGFGKPQCRDCHIAEWKESVKRSTDVTIMKWRPQFMRDRYPRLDGESWPQWSARVAKQIIRDAPSTSPLKWTPLGGERESDEEWFAKRRDPLPRIR